MENEELLQAIRQIVKEETLAIVQKETRAIVQEETRAIVQEELAPVLERLDRIETIQEETLSMIDALEEKQKKFAM